MRLPAVAGAFYAASASALRSEVKGYLEKAGKNVEAKERLAIVCPHAGYVYSGSTAAYSFASCDNWKRGDITAVIIGPNHTGMGTPVSVSFEGWKTPLGEMKYDAAFADAIVKNAGWQGGTSWRICASIPARCSCRFCRWCALQRK